MNGERIYSIERSSLRHDNRGATRAIAGVVAAVLSGVVVPMPALAQERPYDWGMHYMWGAWGVGMMLMMILFWGLIIVGLVFGIRWLISEGKESRSDSALDILRQRYARGEINKEEFETRKREIS